MEFLIGFFGAFFLLLIIALSKGAVMILHPSNRKVLHSPKGNQRNYSQNALNAMNDSGIDKALIEKVIQNGDVKARYSGNQYEYTDNEKRTIVVFTDSNGNVIFLNDSKENNYSIS